MNKNFKKIIAAVMAAATLTVGTVGMSANATDDIVENYSWATRHALGSPGSASSSDTCKLAYSTCGAKVKCTGSSHSNVNASGWTWVECPNSNAYMSRTKLYYGSPVVYKPTATGIVKFVKYDFSAYSIAPSADTFNTSGQIAARTGEYDYYQ